MPSRRVDFAELPTDPRQLVVDLHPPLFVSRSCQRSRQGISRLLELPEVEQGLAERLHSGWRRPVGPSGAFQVGERLFGETEVEQGLAVAQAQDHVPGLSL